MTVLNCSPLKGTCRGGRSGLWKRFTVCRVASAVPVTKVFAHPQLSTGERTATRCHNPALLPAGAAPGTTPSPGLTHALIPLFDLQVRQQLGPGPDSVSVSEPVLCVGRCRPPTPQRPPRPPPSGSRGARAPLPCLLPVTDFLVWPQWAPALWSGVAGRIRLRGPRAPTAGSPPNLCLDRCWHAASSPGHGRRE